MPKTSIQTEILRLLADSPQTTAELAVICNQSTRNIRRYLIQLETDGSISHKQNPDDARSSLYYLTNQKESDKVSDIFSDTNTQEEPQTPCLTSCESCPLTVCDLEHDAIQFGIIDAFTAKHLPILAESKRWERRQNPHTKVWTLYPPALHPLTLQVSVDSVTVYSSEPGDVEWIVGWFATYFGTIHPHADALAHKLRHPEIYRDEQTIVITDTATIEALRSISAPYADPRNRVQYIESPNSTTPGLKIYERDNTMRIEFDARDEARSRSAMMMRSELLELLPKVSLRPGLFLQWRNKYYNPVIQPVIINLEQQDVVTAIHEMAAALSARLDSIEKRVEGYDDDLTDLINELESMNDAELESLVCIIKDYTGSEDAAYVFIAAWQLWELTRFKGSVTRSEVGGLFERSHINKSTSQIATAVDALIQRRLLAPNSEHLHFTKAGIAVGKALTGAYKRKS